MNLRPCLAILIAAEPVDAEATVMLPLTPSITLDILRDFSVFSLPAEDAEDALDVTPESKLLPFLLGDLILRDASLEVVLEGIIDLTLSVRGRRAGVEAEAEVEAMETPGLMNALDEANSCDAMDKSDAGIASAAAAAATEPGGGIKEATGFIESTDSERLRFFSFFRRVVSSAPSKLLALKGEDRGFRASPMPAEEQRRTSPVFVRAEEARADWTILFLPSNDLTMDDKAESSMDSSELLSRLDRFFEILLTELPSSASSFVSSAPSGPADSDLWRN